MSYADYLQSTPPEINIRIEAWNEARHTKAADDYALASLIRIGIASVFNKENKFPRFESFYPEAKKTPQKVEKHVTKAMETAHALGHI